MTEMVSAKIREWVNPVIYHYNDIFLFYKYSFNDIFVAVYYHYNNMKRVKKLQIQQLDGKIRTFKHFPDLPLTGWIRAIRTALNMTLQQLGSAMGITPSNVREMERREKDGTITLKTLGKAAAALNMKLVYGFLPLDGSFEKMIENKALIVARKIVLRTDTTMKLEDQQVSKERLEKAIKELAEEIKNDMPKYLWD
jgi:predicted DNA-binding mobile mystery protein A